MSRLTDEQLRRLAKIWEEVDAEMDASTERTFAIACERASTELGVDVDDGDVSDALFRFVKHADSCRCTECA